MGNSTQFADACSEHYRLTGDIALKWNENVITSARTGIVPDGSGKPALSVGAGVGKTTIYDNYWTIGFRLYFDSQAGWGGQGPLYTCSAANRDPIGMVSVEHDGTLSLWAGNRHTLLANSGTFGFSIHGLTSYYFEISTQITSSAPMHASVVLKINGILVCNGAGDTGINDTDTLLQSANANYHQIQDANIVNGHCWVRDVYIANILGAFRGDIGLGATFPISDSGGSGFTAVGSGSGLFGHVNAQYPDINDDTIYIKAKTVADAAEFLFQPLDTGTPVPFVSLLAYHKKDAEGTRTWRFTMDGVEQGPTFSSGDDYRYDQIIFDKGPGGVDWDDALFNSTSFGVIIKS